MKEVEISNLFFYVCTKWLKDKRIDRRWDLFYCFGAEIPAGGAKTMSQEVKYPTPGWNRELADLLGRAEHLYSHPVGPANRMSVSIYGRDGSVTRLESKRAAGSKLVVAHILGVLGGPNRVDVMHSSVRILAGGVYNIGSTVTGIIGVGTDHRVLTRYFHEHAEDELAHPGNHGAIRALINICEKGGTIKLTIN